MNEGATTPSIQEALIAPMMLTLNDVVSRLILMCRLGDTCNLIKMLQCNVTRVTLVHSTTSSRASFS